MMKPTIWQQFTRWLKGPPKPIQGEIVATVHNTHACERCERMFYYNGTPETMLCPDCEQAMSLGMLGHEYCQCGECIGVPMPDKLPAMVDGFPRRSNSAHWTDTERAIHHAIDIVERSGAHPLLTDASLLLQQAANRVADYLEADHE